VRQNIWTDLRFHVGDKIWANVAGNILAHIKTHTS
jgi:hypothetical protein